MNLNKIILLFITLFIFGCGSSDTTTLISRDNINVITGSVTKGIVTSGVVKAYDEDGKLLGSSDIVDGNYSIEVVYSGKVLLKAQIDQYIDELTQNKINVDNLELDAVSFVDQSSAKVFVTPLTTLTYKSLGGSSLKLKNISIEDIHKENIKIAEALNIGKFDVTKEPYNIVTKGDDLNSTNANKYGLVLASISAESNVTSTYSASENKNKVESLIDTLYQNMEKNDTKAISTIIKSGVKKLEIPLDNNNSILTNDAPVANDINITIDEDNTTTITLNATDIDGDDLNYSIVTNVTHGELNTTNAPIITYTPQANFNGTDSFTYKVSDGKTNSNIATVNIIVTNVNDAPVVSDLNITTAEDSEKNITLSGSDVDGNTLTYSIVKKPTNGDINGTLPNIVYIPHKNFNGTDSFTYKANDGTIDSNIATVNITVTNVNDAPVAKDINITINENTQNNEINITATDADGDDLNYSIVTNVTHGELNTTNAPILTYTPQADFNGTDSFTYKVSDGKADSNIATINITINNVNEPPVAYDKNVTLIGEDFKTITLTATDPDGDSLDYEIRTQPSHGTISGTPPNIVYTPNSNYYGTDSFTFRVSDSQKYSNEANISISIPAPFITKWSVSSSDTQIVIPTNGTGYNYTVKWGDDTSDTNITGTKEHTFDTDGTYIVKIFGNFPRIDFSQTGDINKTKIVDILSWGDINWSSMQKAFFGCSELNITATDKPDLSSVTNLSQMFEGAVKVDINISDWNITTITDMTDMFKDVNLSVANYDALLKGWASQSVENNVTFSAGLSQYSDDANSSKTDLNTTHGWTITDGGWTSN